MSLSDFPYRIVITISEQIDDGRHYKWLFQFSGYGGTNKIAVQEALKSWYNEGNALLDTTNEKWTIKATKKWREVKMKYYFKEKKDAAMFKMIWGGMEE